MRMVDGMQHYIVAFVEQGSEDLEQYYVCWAEDHGHAGEQCEDAYPDLSCINMIETEAEYEARTGHPIPLNR